MAQEIRTRIEPTSSPRMRGARYAPADFDLGSRVRIYTAHATDTEVYILEGTVIEPNFHKRTCFREEPALRLHVDRRGKLMRGEPRELCAPNLRGYQVQGSAVWDKKVTPYPRGYFYRSITLAELIGEKPASGSKLTTEDSTYFS